MVASVGLYGHHVGVLSVERDGRLTFEYDNDWLQRIEAGDPKAHVLSQSISARFPRHDHAVIAPFFEGLLPDNPNARTVLTRHFQLDVNDVYGLLFELGRECPGAVTLLPMGTSQHAEIKSTEYSLLSDEELHNLIVDLPKRPLFVDADGEVRLSLAGVHDKAAVILIGGKIALAKNQTPTTHILKTDIQSLPDSIRLENYCLRVAAAVGIDTVKSVVRVVDDVPYMLVARYDRSLARDENGLQFVRRIHQEDFCQAMGFYPREKYEKDGGPGWKQCFALLDRFADPRREKLELLNRAHFQYLIGNPDAHAKNYSMIYKPDGLHLSKFYDLNNAAAYKAHYKRQTPRLAMLVGGERNPEELTREHFEQFGKDIGMRPDFVLSTLQTLAEKIQVELPKVHDQMKGTVEHSPLFDLADADVLDRCERVLGWTKTLSPR